MSRLLQRLQSIIQSQKLFYGTLAVFVFQSSWIALSGLYSMAFDENTHLGIIRLYAKQLSPFWSDQPDGPVLFGAIARDPSYLYHYLMSFPYRVIEQLFDTQTSQVLALRFMSIAFFVAGLVVYRKVLRFSRAGEGTINIVLALLVLTPVVPFLAAQINYDNLVFLLSGVVILLTLQVAEKLKNNQIDIARLLALVILCLLTGLVKYAFLPVALAVFIYLAWQFKSLFKNNAKKSLTTIKLPIKIILLCLLAISFGLFAERYAVNAVRYHTPTPECDQVLGIERCMDYGPWRRNYLTQQDFIQGKLENLAPRDPLQYLTRRWLPVMGYKLFYVSTGEATQFIIGQPLPVSLILATIFGVGGGVLVLLKQRELRHRYNLNLFILATGLLAVVLFTQNYLDLLHIGYPYAIQSRYLLPVLPFIYLFVALAFVRALAKWPQIRLAIASILIVVFLTQCSGFVTYVVRSDDWWYWPNETVKQANRTARTIIRPVVIGAKQALPTISL